MKRQGRQASDAKLVLPCLTSKSAAVWDSRLAGTKCSRLPLQIDEDWSGTRVGEWISKRLGVWKRLGPFFLRIFDRHPEVQRVDEVLQCSSFSECKDTLQGPAMSESAHSEQSHEMSVHAAKRPRAVMLHQRWRQHHAAIAVQGTRAWAQRILGFDFDTIISSHVVAPIPDGKAQFAACFPELADQQAQARPAAAESVRM